MDALMANEYTKHDYIDRMCSAQTTPLSSMIDTYNPIFASNRSLP